MSEFHAADPECDLLIDLDRNNSSGLFPYDFKHLKTFCFPDEDAAVCDDDLYIHSSFPLDSVRLCIRNHGHAAELLVSSSLPVGFQWRQRNDSCYTLFKPNASDAEYIAALKSVRFHMADINAPAGLRVIEIQGFNALKQGKIVQCFIHAGRKPNAGTDSTLVLCQPLIDADLRSFLSAGTSWLGSWSPSLLSGSHRFDSRFDTAARYAYILSDPLCGNDTATLVVDKQIPEPISLGPDRYMCNGDTVVISLDRIPPLSTVALNGRLIGDALLRLVEPGVYTLSVTTEAGCLINDTLEIKKRPPADTLTQIIHTCQNKPFTHNHITYFSDTTIVETVSPPVGCDTLRRLQVIFDANPVVRRDVAICRNDSFRINNRYLAPGQAFVDTVAATDGCDTLAYYHVRAFPQQMIRLLGDTIICENQLAAISANAFMRYRWSHGDSAQTVFLSPGSYSLTVTDQYNCTQTAAVSIAHAPMPLAHVIAVDPVCHYDKGSIIVLPARQGTPPFQYSLNRQAISPDTFPNLDPGLYFFALSDANRCTFYDTITLTGGAPFDVSVPNEINTQPGLPFLLNIQPIAGSVARADIVPPLPAFQLTGNTLEMLAEREGLYLISFFDPNDCKVTRPLKISFDRPPDVFVPNAFSPNGDNVNDLWKWQLPNRVHGFEVLVFDRWGQLVFRTADPDHFWDGRFKNNACPPGVFVYRMRFVNDKGVVRQLSGQFTLIR